MKLLRLTLLSISFLPLAYSQVVQWDLQRRVIQPEVYRRSNEAIETTIKNERARGGYYATIGVGNPSQPLTLQIDTGSSDVWVPSSNAGICTSAESRGCTFGSCMFYTSFRPDTILSIAC